MTVRCVANHNAPLHFAQLVQSMLAEHHIQQERQPHKFPPHASVLVFPISCDKNAVRGKAFEDEERSKLTSHSKLYRCTKQTTRGASSSGSASGISLSRQKDSGSEGISTS